MNSAGAAADVAENRAATGQNHIEDANSSARGDRRFRAIAAATVITIYLLILVGGIVRATGSGMGCPDWPTCFGQWIPPVSESELPAGYQQTYADHGYANTTFNVRKTWTEYLNRLLGVFTGLLIFLTLLASLSSRARDNTLFRVSLAGFLLVGFQGWLGSRVVASNLEPGMITLHMLVAQVIVGLLIYSFVRSQRPLWLANTGQSIPRSLVLLLYLAIGASLLQIILGTQVREAVDLIARQSNNENRHLWIDNLPVMFSLHRLFAYPAVAINVLFVIGIFRMDRPPRSVKIFSGVLLGLVIGTLVLGMSLDRMNVPVFAQPLHLWFASMILGTQFYLLVAARYLGQRTTGGTGHESADHPGGVAGDAAAAAATH